MRLGEAGYAVTVFESRSFLGGRATSYPLPSAEGETETIDNCQHILLRCCDRLLDFYKRLGVKERILFHREYYFIEPGGRTTSFAASWMPAPLHLASAFLALPFLRASDKWVIARALNSVGRERRTRSDLDEITMRDWLGEKRQPQRAIDRFWRPVLVSAVNEELENMAATHGLHVMELGFLASSDGYEMGVPSVPLADLYSSEIWRAMPQVKFRFRRPVERVVVDDGRASGVRSADCIHEADSTICAVPFEGLPPLIPDLGLSFAGWGHSPITGIHLWFDRAVTELPHGALLDRTIQWFFNKHDGRYLQLVVSASRSLLEMERGRVIEMAVSELGEFLPAVRAAKLEKAHVVKEARATFSARPGLEWTRPGPRTRIANLYLAGDWTQTGWPATMESAVRSGYAAAEAVLGERRTV